MLEKAPLSIIYFDSAATTSCPSEVVEAMSNASQNCFANPASPHRLGRLTMREVQRFTKNLSTLIGCHSNELTLTSGATESNNIVLLGCLPNQAVGKNIVICPIDHKSTIEAAKEMARRGIEVRRMLVDQYGRINLEHLASLIDTNTVLVSLSYVNSEIGTVQDLAQIEALLHKFSALLHIDASQAIGKLPINVSQSRIDCLSFSAHKIRGPKGIGALYVRHSAINQLQPLTFGGGQYKLRSGTLPVPLVAGFSAAADLLSKQGIEALWEGAKIRHHIILESLQRHEVEYAFNSSLDFSVPHIMNLFFPGVRSETIINGLSRVCVASGSACNSRDLKPSYVLTTLGHSDNRANCSIRLSLMGDMAIEDARLGAELFAKKVKKLQALTFLEETNA